MCSSPYSEPLFSSHREKIVLGKFSFLGVLGLGLGDVHLPYTFQNCHEPFKHFIPPLLSSKTSQPVSCRSLGHPVPITVSCRKPVEACFDPV